jgi:hypothetical protein
MPYIHLILWSCGQLIGRRAFALGPAGGCFILDWV